MHLAPGQGRAQREPAVRARTNQWGASKPTARCQPASSGRGAFLIVRAFYRIGFRCAQRGRTARHVLYAPTSHALGMHDRHVQCPCGAARAESVRRKPTRRDKWERERKVEREGERERERERKRTSDLARRPESRELSRHVPGWHFVLSRSTN